MLEYVTVIDSEHSSYKIKQYLVILWIVYFPFSHNMWLVVIISELQFTTNSKATFYDSKKQRPYE